MVGVHDCGTDDEWTAFLGLSGAEHDPALATVEGRLARVEAAEALVADYTRKGSAPEVVAALQAAGIAAAQVQDGRQVSEDPQLAHRKIAEPLEHPVIGPARHVAPAFKLSRTPAQVGLAPCLGADTSDVLRDVAGMSEAQIAELAEAGVLQ